MNKVIDKGFRSCRFVSTIVKHPVHYMNKMIEVKCICQENLIERMQCTKICNVPNSNQLAYPYVTLSLCLHSL